MTVTQTVEIPADRRLFVEVPQEVPTGKTILTYTSVVAGGDTECSQAVDFQTDELRIQLQKLRGSLGKNAFGGLDGVAYQRKVRSEWVE